MTGLLMIVLVSLPLCCGVLKQYGKAWKQRDGYPGIQMWRFDKLVEENPENSILRIDIRHPTESAASNPICFGGFEGCIISMCRFQAKWVASSFSWKLLQRFKRNWLKQIFGWCFC